jgi:Bacterial Ig-like domain
MKRRAILAGLLLVALAALAVVLVRSGGAGQAIEGVKGQPFKGESGVSRSVASIKALQRYRDRHPEVERQRTAELSAQEAAREEATREGEAAGEATGEAAGENIREKPEPGEETGPPKRQPATTRQQRVGAAAITPSQAVTPSAVNFLGAKTSESGFVPPDSMGSVGPSQVVVFVNGVFKVFDKQGNQVVPSISDAAFWAPVRGSGDGSEPTDPGVEFDRLSQRWIVSGINTEDTNNRIMLAVSDGPTITSTSDFTYFFFNEATPPPSASPRFADYPQLGVDANAIYIGVNEFSSASAGGFLGTSVFVIRKSSVLGAGPIVVTAFRNLISGSPQQGPVSPQPATDTVPSVGSGYIVGSDATFFSRLDVRRITNPGGTPSISGNLTVTVPQTFAPTTFGVPAQGTSGGLDALDDRLFEAMIGRDPNGNDTLWTAHNLLMNSSGVSSAGGDRAGARWYQVGSLGTTPSLIQSGNLVDSAASNPRQFWIPSIAMNGQGHASLNTSTAGATHPAGVADSGRLFTDTPGTTEPFQIPPFSSGSGSYNLGADTPRRWGDFSQTVIDPSDNMSFWTFQEYTNSTNSWGVRVIKLLAPPPADPSTATPSSVPQGQCSVAVDVDGTSTDGSGFFDPGPAYPSHIAASATGGVAVNDVTYTDPTHVTLDLDTTAAASGPVDVTITNPDGQSVTATGLITVDPPATGPTTPCLDGTTPDSPANENDPEIFGRADPGSTVTLYTDPGCATGTEVGTGTDTEFAAPGIPVDSVPDNSSTTYYAKVTDSLSNDSACSSTLGTAEASVTYVEDSIPPVPSVDGGPSGLTNDRTPTFSFSATDPSPPINFECSIDTGTPNFGSCSGPGDTHTPSSPLSDGPYTFRVKATDAAGNSAEATRSFQVDATPPSVSVESGPSGVTDDQQPTFTFSGTDAVGPLSFQCSIDSGTASFRGCSGPGNSDRPSSPLGFGSYTFRVRGTDGAGNTSSASRSFSVKGPPETTITKGPKKTRKVRPKFKFTASDPVATFECKLDKGQFAPCASPFRPPKLRPGKHKLKVRAVSDVGTDGTPAVRKFRILPPG